MLLLHVHEITPIQCSNHTSRICLRIITSIPKCVEFDRNNFSFRDGKKQIHYVLGKIQGRICVARPTLSFRAISSAAAHTAGSVASQSLLTLPRGGQRGFIPPVTG